MLLHGHGYIRQLPHFAVGGSDARQTTSIVVPLRLGRAVLQRDHVGRSMGDHGEFRANAELTIVRGPRLGDALRRVWHGASGFWHGLRDHRWGGYSGLCDGRLCHQ